MRITHQKHKKEQTRENKAGNSSQEVGVEDRFTYIEQPDEGKGEKKGNGVKNMHFF